MEFPGPLLDIRGTSIDPEIEVSKASANCSSVAPMTPSDYCSTRSRSHVHEDIELIPAEITSVFASLQSGTHEIFQSVPTFFDAAEAMFS